MHDEAAGKADSRIDLNRTGTPLLEIVSQPDLRSPAEAKAYLTELKLLLNYLGVSDCNMQEGSLRVDANINLHVDTPEGKVATPIVEVKNMNSFRAVERALAYEAERQYDEWQETGRRLGDRGPRRPAAGTKPPRSPGRSGPRRNRATTATSPTPTWCRSPTTDERGRARSARRWASCRRRCATRLETDLRHHALRRDVLVNQGRALVDYYVELADACGDGKAAANWVQQDVLRTLNERADRHRRASPCRPTRWPSCSARSPSGQLTTSRGREVLAEMIASGKLGRRGDGGAWASSRSTTRSWKPSAASCWRPTRRSWPDVKEGKLKAAGVADRPGEEEETQRQPGPQCPGNSVPAD